MRVAGPRRRGHTSLAAGLTRLIGWRGHGWLATRHERPASGKQMEKGLAH